MNIERGLSKMVFDSKTKQKNPKSWLFLGGLIRFSLVEEDDGLYKNLQDLI
jgi:hypothetical protein